MTTGPLNQAVAHVESELGAYWASLKGEGGEIAARAATLNLVWATVPSEIEQYRRALQQLAHSRAGRAFMVALDGRLASWDAESDASAACYKEGETVVCYDWITFRFGALAASRTASVIKALALPEVPIVLEIARGAPDALGEALVTVADRIVVDTVHTSLSRVAALMHMTAAPFADRAWVRTYSWRDLTARFFDDAKGAASAITRLEIERTHAPGCDPAPLFMGWLGSRLGLRVNEEGCVTDARGRHIPVDFTSPREVDLPPGELTAVRIDSVLSGVPLSAACVRQGASRVVQWTRAGARNDAHEHPLGFRDETWVLGKAIDATECDHVYREAVLWGATAYDGTAPIERRP